jgi:hypothetical protein
VIAGKYLYVGDGGDPVGGFGGTTQFGQLNVLELLPGADTVPVFNAAHQGVWGIAGMAARNRTDRYRANPVFAGDRLYLRTYNGVVCVAVTTPAGQRYQDEVLAKTTLAELIGPPPKQLSTVAFTALTDFVPAAGHAVSRLLPRQMPKQWLMLGPLAPGTPPPTGVPTANDAGGKWQCLPETAFTDAGEIDALAAADRKSGTESYFFTVLDSTRRQTMTLACPNDKLTVWVAGKELKSGDHLQFEIGHYPVLIRHRLDPVPPFIKSVPASFSFTASETVADTIESWRARVRILRPRLEAIIKSLPNTAEAATAQAYLKEASSP